jgi:hypothetical protein
VTMVTNQPVTKNPNVKMREVLVRVSVCKFEKILSFARKYIFWVSLDSIFKSNIWWKNFASLCRSTTAYIETSSF